MRIFFIFTILSIFINNCSGNYQDVKVVGKVINKENNKPIPGVEVKITWWIYDTSTAAWESKPHVDTFKTDLDGRFVFFIMRAESYDLAITHPNYKNHTESRTLGKNFTDVIVLLDPNENK